MTTTALRFQSIHRTMHRKITSLQVVKINWKAIYLLALGLCAIMIVFYVFAINQLTQGSFLIKNYNKEIKSLLAENRDLQADFAENSFWGGVYNQAKELNFERTPSVTYIKILQNSLAEAK